MGNKLSGTEYKALRKYGKHKFMVNFIWIFGWSMVAIVSIVVAIRLALSGISLLSIITGISSTGLSVILGGMFIRPYIPKLSIMYLIKQDRFVVHKEEVEYKNDGYSAGGTTIDTLNFKDVSAFTESGKQNCTDLKVGDTACIVRFPNIDETVCLVVESEQ